MVSWIAAAPWRGLTACLLVSGVVGLLSLASSNSVGLAAGVFVAVFSVSSLLVADTEAFKHWRPRNIVGRAVKTYVQGYASIRYGRGRVILRRLLLAVMLFIFAAVVVLVLRG